MSKSRAKGSAQQQKCVHGMRSAVTSSPLQRVYQKTYAAGPAPKAGEGKMRYVPPPQAAQAAAATTSPPGKGKMKYVPPPTNAGVWNRPERAAGGPNKWEELAAKEEAHLKAGKKLARTEMKQENAVAMSGNDMADMLATKKEYDMWTKQDVQRALAWSRAEECRIPNKRVAKGGRLHKLINILLNNCDFVNDRISGEKRFLDASRDPTMASGLELKRQFVASLAKRVLNKVEEEEIEKSFKDDDPDSDDSEGMAM